MFELLFLGLLVVNPPRNRRQFGDAFWLSIAVILASCAGAFAQATVPPPCVSSQGVPSPVHRFTNATSVLINPRGAADPFPTSIPVAGLTGAICRVAVTLHGLAHSFPADLDVLLVAPDGTGVLLLSDAGSGDSVSNITLTLDDAAAQFVPERAVVTSGVFKPSNYGNKIETLPPPAPTNTPNTVLAAFHGRDPNGTWALYINDDEDLDAGRLAEGWSIDITLVPQEADLVVAQRIAPNPVAPGGNVMFTISVTNLGPAAASEVVLSNQMPANVTFLNAVPSQGACAEAQGTVNCQLGALAPGAVVHVNILAAAHAIGSETNFASASSTTDESFPLNNSATAVIHVLEPVAILLDPSNVTACPGDVVTFAVVAAGAEPLFYQWSRGEALLPDATNATLQLPGVSGSGVGEYRVRVSNAVSSTTTTASLSLVSTAAIALPPADVRATFGGTATFTITATSPVPIAYQWLLDGAPIPFALAPTLTISNVDLTHHDGGYSVAVSNCAGSVTSTIARLTVKPFVPEYPPTGGYALTNALGSLRFDQPVLAVAPPGETNRLFVLERPGNIVVVSNLGAPTAGTFLSLTSSIYADYIESGLLGMAFHPGYASNRQFFVFRTLVTSTEGASNALHWQLSRFETDPENPNAALTNSEVVLIVQRDESAEHNAGDIQFGPDGYLYVAMGDDGPPASDFIESRQPINKSFFGGVLRLDVDQRPGSLPPNLHPSSTTNYTVPADNPFVGATLHLGLPVDPAEVRTEYFAIGLRNPFRMSFDALTGLLYCGEVGEGLHEEIDIITPGGNYGWPYYEAHLLWSQPPPAAILQPPFLSYRHGSASNEGNCVIGGVVARNNPLPTIEGMYIFGDNVRGQIWAVPADAVIVTNRPFTRLTADPGLSAFARDPRDGAVLVVNLHDGQIKKLTYTPHEAEAPFPPTLAATGLFADPVTLTPSAELTPYEIAVPFWSDNAIKSRWFMLPDPGARFGFSAEDKWTFPPGSVWVKHFDLPLTNGIPESSRRLETRLLVKTTNSIYGVTYRWDDTQTNAMLVSEAGLNEAFAIHEGSQIRTQLWRYPSFTECLSCHNAGGGTALGFSTAQLNINVPCPGGTTNQLLAFSRAGYLDTLLTNTTTLPILAHRTNTHYPVSFRARSHLAANCAQCHQPGASYTLAVNWDGRISTRLDDARILGHLIKPQLPNESHIWIRMASPDHSRMPPIGTSVLDRNGMGLIQLWAQTIPVEPWMTRDIGGTRRETHASIEGDIVVISGSGTGVAGTNDSLGILARPLTWNAVFITELTDLHALHPAAQAGVFFRESPAGNARHFDLMLDADGHASSHARAQPAADSTTTTTAIPGGTRWLRVTREGTALTAHYSPDGNAWTLAASNQVSFPPTVLAGFGVTAHDNAAWTSATFQNTRHATVALSSSAAESVLSAPATVPMAVGIDADGLVPAQVEFFANGERLAVIDQPPFQFDWLGAPAGAHSIKARVTFSSGFTLETEPLPITIRLPDAFSNFVGTDSITGGAWTNLAHVHGAIIAADSTNLSPNTLFWMFNALHQTWEIPTADPRGLLRANASERLAANWNSPSNLVLNLWLGDGELSLVSIYCVDWDGGNSRSQRIEIFDPNTQTVLDTRTLSAFSGGTYLSWSVRGQIEIRVTRLEGASAVVSGVFLAPDMNAAPQVSLVAPTNFAQISLPAPVLLAADATDADGSVTRVEFRANGSKIAEAAAPPYTAIWTNLLAGTYEVVARAFDNLGDWSDSAPASLVARLPATSGALRSTDTFAQGNWIGRYGSDGYLIINDHTNLPPSVQLQVEAGNEFTFANYTDAPSALQRVDITNRIAACWYEMDAISVNIRLADGRPRLLTAYFLDWLGSGRAMNIELLDGLSGALLTSQSVTDFGGGQYLTWAVQGHITLRVTRLQGANAVISGLFLDPDTNARPTIALTRPAGTESLIAPMLYALSASATDADGIRNVRFYTDGTRVGISSNAPYRYVWSVLSGTYPVTAEAVDTLGGVQPSASARLTVGITNADAVFVGTDTNTAGTWIGTYGTEGHVIFMAATNTPREVLFGASGFYPFIADNGSIDPRAPQRPNGETRISGAIVADPEGRIDITLRDGRYHQLAIYCFDFGDNLRAQRFSIHDADTGQLLDSRVLTYFNPGAHLKWNVRGRIRITVVSTNEYNATVQALFIDPVPGSFDQWRTENFTAAALRNTDVSGDLADPDRDGVDNLFEYLRGTDPQAADLRPAMDTRVIGGRLQFSITRRKSARYVSLVPEVSNDTVTWTSGDDHIEQLPVEDLGDAERLTFRTRSPLTESPARFARLRLVRH